MNKKTTIILLITFLILFFAASIYKISVRQKAKSDKPFSELVKTSISKIVISGFVFEKSENGSWLITSPGIYPADEKAVNRVIDNTVKLELGDVISTNQEKQQTFQVDKDAGGIPVSIFYKDSVEPAANFILGKMAFDYFHYYFRYPESSEIIVSKGLNRYDVERRLKEWRDKEE